MKIVIMKGLPASGKSTKAKEYYLAKGNNYKRINKDDLRLMVDNGKYSKKNEKHIVQVQMNLLEYYLRNDISVVIDDTNLNPVHIARYKKFAQTLSEELNKKINIVIDFINTPLEECIKRDIERDNSVGEKVIKDMYNKWLKKDKQDLYNYKPFKVGLNSAIICDIDGTLAGTDTGEYYHRDFLKDVPNMPVVKLVNNMFNNCVVILVSGRSDEFSDMTIEWLKKHKINYDHLFMRKTGDQRSDYIIKKEIFNNCIDGKFNIEFVLDDRNQTVQCWRDLNLPCFQVLPGGF